ncbi:DUF512 domain-containing protein [Halanaerobium sp. Z-7514]|uniref:DUF512 domain-containing protein n=1 Tax=Halanaerobium polyolivorans TaxID=2886943 RepID=A0AAW4WZD6_9FIRM|nr:DUF512 domain-containing protein [Halanaerobium polyolivorans]MCC3144810.1 DUF512 domain-containing protein [Halanaerobium polyolivorans]
MVKIEKIIEGSTAFKAGLKASDKIITINNQKINDYIDYLYQISEPIINLQVQRADNTIQEFQLQRKLDEELGIEFKEIIFDGLKQCKNNCVFCFVKQQPPKMRDSLMQKDDDYRFSFLQGSFITLTNLNQSELQRIIEKRLSPLNISVHTTNPELRVKMMKNKRAAEINQLLKLLKENGIEFHTQIVLCPDYNDGQELDRTLKDLLELYPALLSIGVVPVGITKHREGLAELRTLTEAEMKKALSQIKKWQKKSTAKFGENIIYAADEFYLNTANKLPRFEEYADFPQLENGIGLTALFLNSFNDLSYPDQLPEKNKMAVITGELGKKAIQAVIEKLNQIKNLEIDILEVKNDFFGRSVTVTGLLTAEDIEKRIKKIPIDQYQKIIIPDIVLNDENKFLDGSHLKQFKKKLKNYQIDFVGNLKDLVEVIEND